MPPAAHAPTVAIETHGCKLNQADAQDLARRFRHAGYQVVEPEGRADVYVLNTCTVTHVADAKARHAARAMHRRNPRALVVVTGCYAERAPGELASVDGITLVVGNRDKDSLVDRVLDAHRRPPSPCAVGDEASWQEPLPGRTRAMVKIQEGCNQVCAYCIVPRVRGRERSIPQAQLVAQVQALADEGYREVVLTGTQLGSYGHDRPGETLHSLLCSLLEQTTIQRLRVSSLQPQEITPQLLDLWRDPRLCPHFHIPLQSGSDAVLARMRRRYDATGYARAAERVRERVAGATVTTDVIVGFPGESEEDFQRTYELCQRMGFARIHVFPYSRRPGTSAARFGNQVDAATKKRRLEALLELSRRQEEAFLRGQVGYTLTVLWEGRSEDRRGSVWSGLAPNYARVFTRSNRDLTNALTPVRVVAYERGRLWAEVTDS